MLNKISLYFPSLVVHVGAPAPEGSSSLTKLLLSACSLTNKTLQTLAGKIPGKLDHLIYLDLSSNEQLTTECLSCIAAMCSSPGMMCLAVFNLKSWKRSGWNLFFPFFDGLGRGCYPSLRNKRFHWVFCVFRFAKVQKLGRERRMENEQNPNGNVCYTGYCYPCLVFWCSLP